MEPTWFDKLKQLIAETLNKIGRSIDDGLVDIQRITLDLSADEGATVSLGLEVSHGMSGFGSFIDDVPRSIWEEHQQKLTQFATTLFVEFNGERCTLTDAIQKLVDGDPALVIDPTAFDYGASNVLYYYSDDDGNLSEINLDVIG